MKINFQAQGSGDAELSLTNMFPEICVRLADKSGRICRIAQPMRIQVDGAVFRRNHLLKRHSG
jgi:hypothetical protein